MKERLKVNPGTTEWLTEEESYIADLFVPLGIGALKNILNMRVFDLMNMNRLSAIHVEEVLISLYRFLNPNHRVDDEMYEGRMTQPFAFPGWRKEHRDLSRVTVSDIVMAPDINRKAIERLYDSVRKKFFVSGEYDPREYRYRDYQEYLEILRKNGEAAENDK